jgi:hypothetical protein
MKRQLPEKAQSRSVALYIVENHVEKRLIKKLRARTRHSWQREMRLSDREGQRYAVVKMSAVENDHRTQASYINETPRGRSLSMLDRQRQSEIADCEN